jgi:hypothetical protein
MSQIPNKYADSDKGAQIPGKSGTHAGLASYCMTRVLNGRLNRDNKHGVIWKEYTRLWRGFHTEKDKNSDSERSKLIAPALQQAVEMTVAEMEEAVFSRTAWFDLNDDINDNEKDDALVSRDLLIEDFEMDAVPDAISKVFLLGAIYGTGIAKLNVVKSENKRMGKGGKVTSTPRVKVTVEALRPDEFVIDPSALNTDEGEFCAHEMIRPLHGIQAKQKAGVYKGPLVREWSGQRVDADGTQRHSTTASQDNAVLITEYYGQVPSRFIPEATAINGMVEAIVTIANESTVLKAVESPFTMKDRPIVAYQHDTVPGEFWGRGVCEKGYNPQKALDAELRARIDALALLTAPMMGADITRLPRNGDLRVRPGKTVFTRGRPSEILEPLSFGNPAILAHTFQQTGDLERMVQMGTGAMDSATPVGVNSRNETASGMSQLQAGFIKRSKRTMQNLERQFLDPLIKKAQWRYVQFAPARYPKDTRFTVNATMGIMAKEVENSQLINMLGFVPPDSAAHPILIKAIFDNSASANKRELSDAVAEMTKPPSPEAQQRQQQLEQLQLQLQIATVEKEKAEAEKEKALAIKAQADTGLIIAKTQHEYIVSELEDDKVEIMAANAVTGAEKARVGREATNVSREKNQIDREKNNKPTSS